ncbi:hypothetical protein FRB94_013640 [Tulasnella sp. JGI-2019a]|nr:hypothetical protein FRB94_013640 [Tulasnella sp. JGI-2019a]KAG8998993.1 hypothetical protein FRB93_013403 [Tulasnella sp. JGI-2019a]
MASTHLTRSLGATASSSSAAYLHTSSSSRSPKQTPSKTHHFQPIPDSSFPRGYLATGLYCGVKKHKDTSAPPPNDLAVILSTTHRTSSAACFTLNAFKAAPVVVSTEVLAKTSGRARALVVNSGCANAVTGKQGLQDAWAMAKATDALVSKHGYRTLSSPSESHTLVMSTGVIGQLLPTPKILTGISNASLSSGFEAWSAAAKAFMTTDTFPKLRARSYVDSKGKTVRIAGMDKGAGMIHPKMGPPGPPHATLLGMIATDASITPNSLQSALTWAVERSFNSISVDGDMSTNDTIVCFANGANEMEEIDQGKDEEAYMRFRDELTSFAVDLAKLVVLDGEGATKFVTVTVEGATSYEDAHKIASTVSTSSLVKCALYGEDANWGRILCAVGYTSPLSTLINPTEISLSFIPSDGSEPLKLLTKGEPEIVDEVRAKKILERDELEIRIELGLGNETAHYYTCDLSHEYVTINGDYRS